IATGALVPRGTDRVLRHELISISDSPAGVSTVTARPEAGAPHDLRPAGEDCPAGVVLAEAGTTLYGTLASAALSAAVAPGRGRPPACARSGRPGPRGSGWRRRGRRSTGPCRGRRCRPVSTGCGCGAR